ncbi:helix-turn-helix transcriptional regulator [Flavisphingomonas formosensis]|uniref:helix-turn-helix transcriptional regulator n=1 Tax=Flavisphingomonas formosensis TaxID=861534 RepID=UPI0012F772C8|nr:helix-turn-helix transcriptional regulator [Sphingomonas formosensis]
MAEKADTTAAFSRLILALNGALVDGEPWRDFLLLLRDHLHAKHATLILTPPHTAELGTMITPSAPPADVAEYLDRFLATDPFVGLPDGQVVALYEYVGESELKNSDYYRDWFERIDGSHVMGVDIRFRSGFEARLRITRAPGGDVFDREERARLERVVPHLRQAVDIYQRLQTSASEQAVMTDAVAQFAVGTVMLDHALNVLKMNEIAASILAEQDGIRLIGNRLAIASAHRDGEFRALLKAAIADAGKTQPVFMVERPSGLRDIGIVVRSVSIPDFMHTGSAPALALFLGDPERQAAVSGDTLRELFGLTPTEAAISASLANGTSVIETARRLGIAENTVRAHLRSIFAKTGVNRQSQLVHLIHTSLPELALSR